MKTFDLVFITHLPSFYKINLYNEISKKARVCVIFIGNNSKIRSGDFTSGEKLFTSYQISNVEFERRNAFTSTIKTLSILSKINYKQIVVGGWDLLEFWAAVIFSRKNKNSLALESTIHDSSKNILKKIFKKIFLSRIRKIYTSGVSHKKLAEYLSFSGEIVITNGVGIINKKIKAKKEKK